jgi:hypothetical protein
MGVSTKLKTTESIYREYEGRDKPEQIKYFIKDAVEEWGVKYVLLVGGLKSLIYAEPREDRNQGSKDWYVPVRYSNLVELGYLYDPGYISDLYYADIYRYNQQSQEDEFEDWDSNGNNVFAEWSAEPPYSKDILDLFPDVYVGRLACRNMMELKTIVNKIKKYETRYHWPFWSKHMLAVGGDTVPVTDESSPYYSFYEGEIVTSLSSSYLKDASFTVKELWVSNDSFTEPRDIIKAISQGAGFIHFDGHGNPSVWSTHPANSKKWIDFLTIDMCRLKNRKKLPIVVVGGCHSSQFNVTLLDTTLDADNSKHTWCYGFPTSECWSWRFIRQRTGGAIAVIGNTGLGYGYPHDFATNGLDGWIGPRFFHAYANQNKEILGEAYGQAIIDYINEFKVNENLDKTDRKTIEQWALLGDPSLKIGGYP